MPTSDRGSRWVAKHFFNVGHGIEDVDIQENMTELYEEVVTQKKGQYFLDRFYERAEETDISISMRMLLFAIHLSCLLIVSFQSSDLPIAALFARLYQMILHDQPQKNSLHKPRLLVLLILKTLSINLRKVKALTLLMLSGQSSHDAHQTASNGMAQCNSTLQDIKELGKSSWMLSHISVTPIAKVI